MYFSRGMGPTTYHFTLKDMPNIYKYHRSLTELPYKSMYGGLFPELIIEYQTISGITRGHHLYFEQAESNVCSSSLL